MPYAQRFDMDQQRSSRRPPPAAGGGPKVITVDLHALAASVNDNHRASGRGSSQRRTGGAGGRSGGASSRGSSRNPGGQRGSRGGRGASRASRDMDDYYDDDDDDSRLSVNDISGEFLMADTATAYAQRGGGGGGGGGGSRPRGPLHSEYRYGADPEEDLLFVDPDPAAQAVSREEAAYKGSYAAQFQTRKQRSGGRASTDGAGPFAERRQLRVRKKRVKRVTAGSRHHKAAGNERLEAVEANDGGGGGGDRTYASRRPVGSSSLDRSDDFFDASGRGGRGGGRGGGESPGRAGGVNVIPVNLDAFSTDEEEEYLELQRELEEAKRRKNIARGSASASPRVAAFTRSQLEGLESPRGDGPLASSPAPVGGRRSAGFAVAVTDSDSDSDDGALVARAAAAVRNVSSSSEGPRPSPAPQAAAYDPDFVDDSRDEESAGGVPVIPLDLAGSDSDDGPVVGGGGGAVGQPLSRADLGDFSDDAEPAPAVSRVSEANTTSRSKYDQSLSSEDEPCSYEFKYLDPKAAGGQ